MRTESQHVAVTHALRPAPSRFLHFPTVFPAALPAPWPPTSTESTGHGASFQGRRHTAHVLAWKLTCYRHH